jgi:pentatricopeptide repeat protein
MCLMSQGKYDEARRVLEEMRQNIPFVPHLKRRLDAAILMDMARSEAQAGRGPEAWPMLCEAEAELMREPRLGVRFLGAQAWLLALRGEHQAAKEKSAAAEEALASYQGDPETIRTVHSDLARAAFAWGDFEVARSRWERYLETRPAPVSVPMAHCYLGNCYEALGDANAARTEYSRALETGIETYYTRQSRERLASLVPA